MKMMRSFNKLLSFTRFSLLLLLWIVPRIAMAGWPSKMGKKDKEKMQNILGGRLEVPAEMDLFVKYKNRRGMRIAKKFGKQKKFKKHLKKFKVVSIHANDSTAVKKLLKNPNIEYVEPQHMFRALPVMEHKWRNTVTESRRIEELKDYGINMIQADQLWGLPPPKEPVTICVIDSGYGLGHPDLPTLQDGVTGTSTKQGNWTDDVYGHGTHSAGVIGAIGNNEIGVAGVMPDPTRFRLHIGKSLDDRGVGSEVDMLDAFDGCMKAGAKVISMSFGTGDYSQTIDDVCKDAYDKGVLLIAAAGNDGDTAYDYPASLPQVMSVVAVDIDRRVAGFSQYNDQVEIAGPGVDILSTVTTKNVQEFDYTTWSGTSMAAPHVAGVAAAVWSYFPTCTNNQIRNVLIRTAKDEKNVGCDEDLGFGIVQAKDAYDLLVAKGCVAGNESPSPLSDGAYGGCSQDPLYTPPPTSAPTPFTCTDKPFILELKTDQWPQETSWELINSENTVVKSGSGYRKNAVYLERFCIPVDDYTFTIRDTEGDGICCNFGNGGYSVTFDNILIKQGGNFAGADVATFGGNHEKSSTINERGKRCIDDPGWVFTTAKGKTKRCKFLEANPSQRCGRKGLDANENVKTGYESCPVTCGSCPKLEESPAPTPNLLPTMVPDTRTTPLPRAEATTSTPTKDPTKSPTLLPTTTPTGNPTLKPALNLTPNPTQRSRPTKTRRPTPAPTSAPTPSPSSVVRKRKSPTSPPISGPTVSPTTLRPANSQTDVPTTTPTPSPTLQPTTKPTTKPTPAPTLQPTTKPTTAPTPAPTSSPTIIPTGQPTRIPTSPPTRNPTTLPTLQPTNFPTDRPSAMPTPVPSLQPTAKPTLKPSPAPTSSPTPVPTEPPTRTPTTSPTKRPTYSPTDKPTTRPTKAPTPQPTPNPTQSPTRVPTRKPTRNPTFAPTPKKESKMCCSQDLKTCRGGKEKYCNLNKENCEDCGSKWIDINQLDKTCIGAWTVCTDDVYGCCPGLECKQLNPTYRQCRPP